MKLFKVIVAAIALSVFTPKADAQYYEIANSLRSLISPALSGSASYKGYVDVVGLGGVGQNRANFVGVSTSQGFQYASWFFMGAGMGIDMAIASNTPQQTPERRVNKMAMLPIFSDFRFMIPSASGSSFFIDAKVGAAWFLGNNYLNLYNGTMGHGAQFFLQPSIGMRIPINASNKRQAINLGATYRLITSNNNYSWNSNSLSLNNFGLSIGFEW